ncbi:cobyric acid synthase [Erythrobacter sp. 3-20A1M]|uniref:cobyric acid synthase n=1 Tax=Erythrobacter sp. 3-20A1M TaxID=2653850 RepID=UPI001BFBFBB6|nr:cobyric acid synthase [Erythrobacter sp. 3-20A1M]QWC57987.1 cobyric acid synthase [Erythrobacter sp. 3-20A1M]
MAGRAIMLQGTGSNVGKSLLVAGLCRIARRRGVDVAPFKPQNMSNNAAACPNGGEIGRAQALQARAAGLEPTTDMNPVLLKPESDRRAQVVLNGKALRSEEAAAYMANRGSLLPAVIDAFDRLKSAHDLVIVEGAGSPAEVNLRKGDIANMGFARAADVPVVLIGDIDRGGVIASLVGTRTVVDNKDADMIEGFLINRFRGDQTLFADGVRLIEDRTGWRSFGIVPWLPCAVRLPAEDAVVLDQARRKDGAILIAVPMLSRISNFDDLDPLRAEPDVEVRFIPPGQPLPREADAIIVTGTKSTLADLAMVRAQGWDHDIIAARRTGAHVVGLCGGFQILGNWLEDADAADGLAGSADGLGLFDMTTVMTREKVIRPISGTTLADGDPVTGYELHTGRSQGPMLEKPFCRLDDGTCDGAAAAGGRLIGTYLHGVFASDPFRSRWLERLRSGRRSTLNYEESVENALDELADGLEASLDVDALLALAR